MRTSSGVLLVEDNPDDIDLIRHAFRKAQVRHPLRVAPDGERAIDYLASACEGEPQGPLPVVVLLDLKLPRMSGFAVLQWIRTHPRVRHVPVVVFTSSGQDEDVRHAYELCASSYLVKPARRAALIDMVQTLTRHWADLNLLPT